MPKLTRRDFLSLSARAGLAVGVSNFLTGCGFEQPILPTPPILPATATARVVIVRGRDLGKMAREALEAVGGAEAIVKPGETVFIKPNLLTAGMGRDNPIVIGECTKPEIVIAVAEECLKAGAAEVTIGDGSQVLSFSWDDIPTLDGSTNYAAAAQRLSSSYEGKVKLACLNADSPQWVPIPSPYTGLEQIQISSLVAQADRVISIPVLKTHRTTGLTLSMKNFVGVTAMHGFNPTSAGRSRLHLARGGVEQCFLDIVSALKPDLTILDASLGCEGYGPYVEPGMGTTVDMKKRLGDWLVIAGSDLVAVDATAARIISHDPAGVNHLVMAYEQGLGQMREDLIEVVGADIGELQVDWLPAIRG